MSEPFDIRVHPIHLGAGAVATVEPAFEATMQWYMAYGERRASDGVEGRLVAFHTSSEPWGNWEVHPNGHEVVIVLSGRLTLIQEIDGAETRVELGPHQAAINPPGVWHTADVHEPTTALFITAGMGTGHRPR